ncbi:MAG: FAD-linked oxidase C-terminal domain-containing protein [Pseudomonadota bacterium]
MATGSRAATTLLARLSSTSPAFEVWTDPGRIEAYLHDEAARAKEPCAAVLFPRSTAEVAQVLRLASELGVPIVPRGAGSGLSGAAVPSRDSIVLSLERMNRIFTIDEVDAIAVVEPGVITGAIRAAVEEKGLFYPPIPASIDLCTIGGNVATNAGGLCAVKYGVTREYVLGLEVVLPTGDVIETGGRYLKNSTGYNLTQLITGSEGTLGVITKIILRLRPLPRERVTLLAPFRRLSEVSNAVVAILAERIVPPTLELLPKGAVRCVLARHTELSYPFPDHEASLLIELDSRDGASIPGEVETLQKVLERCGSPDPLVATSTAQRDQLWSLRKQIRDSIANSGDFIEADSVVPRRNLPALVEAAETIGKQFHLEVISYGHAGDGNLHTYFRRGETPKTGWETLSKKALTAFFEKTIALGGTLSGEHGIGLLKKEYLPMALSQAQIDLMRRLKKAFDPKNILNPGKVIP